MFYKINLEELKVLWKCLNTERLQHGIGPQINKNLPKMNFLRRLMFLKKLSEIPQI